MNLKRPLTRFFISVSVAFLLTSCSSSKWMKSQSANLETIRLLGSAIAKRDSDTDIHNYRVSIYSVRLAEKLGLAAAEIQSLIKGAFYMM